MKTMMATEAPSVNAQRTMLAQPAPHLGTTGTQMITDPKKAVAYANPERVQRARTTGENRQVAVAQSAGALFWIAWVVLGIGAGLGIHFWLLGRG
jgi:hypothetical protein